MTQLGRALGDIVAMTNCDIELRVYSGNDLMA